MTQLRMNTNNFQGDGVMKKVLFVLFALMMLSSFCYAAAPEPSLKVILFYKVSDAILQCQNAQEDLVVGKTELEKELVNHYSKRFIIQGIERIPQNVLLTPPEYFNKVKPGQLPFIIKIDLEGQGQSTTLYQNAYGAQKVGVAPSTNVHLREAIPNLDDNTIYQYDYGVQSYSSGTFAMGRDVVAAQTDPRKNAKNSVRGCFRDACQINDAINKYANPNAYKKELNRFIGNFKPLALAQEKINDTTNAKIEKFKAWCNADKIRKGYLAPLGTTNDINFIISYIDNLAKMGVYPK